MVKYRKKPVVIEARQLLKANAEDVAKWCGGKILRLPTGDENIYGIEIETLEGDMKADIGDMIIKGVQGEFYPCKPDIFAQTYELAE